MESPKPLLSLNICRRRYNQNTKLLLSILYIDLCDQCLGFGYHEGTCLSFTIEPFRKELQCLVQETVETTGEKNLFFEKRSKEVGLTVTRFGF